MCSWGHPSWWRVASGENQSASFDPPADWASAGKTGRRADGGNRRHCLGGSQSGSCFSAGRQTGTIHQSNEVNGRGHRDDLVGRSDAHRARRAAMFGIGETDHRSAGDHGRRALGDHRHVIAIPVHRFDLRIHDRDATTVAIQQPTKGRGKQPWSHRDKHLEWGLRCH